jgi:hypothetical protein
MPIPAEVKAGYRWRCRQELNGWDRYCKLAKRLWPGRSKEHPERSLPKAALQRQPPQPPYRCWVLGLKLDLAQAALGLTVRHSHLRWVSSLARWPFRGGRRIRSGAKSRTAFRY